MSTWTAEQVPDQTGRLAIVTGANSGIGFVAARELRRAGATVVLACRNLEKAKIAAEKMGAPYEHVEALDLADLGSIRAFATRFSSKYGRLDLLINNAGLMAPPRARTSDGFELQFGTNHLGHFALTGLLVNSMHDRPDARIVVVSSLMHRLGEIAFDDLQGEMNYRRWGAYAQSKLANLLFAQELGRRLERAGSNVICVSAHPGYSATNLQFAAPPLLDRLVMRVGNWFAQSSAQGALPTLYAATYPNLANGAFVGPHGYRELRGRPKIVAPQNPACSDEALAARLWEVSERLTGIRFDIDPSLRGTAEQRSGNPPSPRRLASGRDLS